MKKKILTLGLAFALGLSNLAFAEHDAKDPYEAMCQSTGVFSDVKHPVSELDKNGEATALQLFGHCGEQPNLVIIDYIKKLNGFNPPRIRHHVQVWESSKRGQPYWKYLSSRYYVTDNLQNILASSVNQTNNTQFIDIDLPNIMQLTIKRFSSANVGSPIFPDARGDIQCERASDEGTLLEKGYLDYMNEKEKK